MHSTTANMKNEGAHFFIKSCSDNRTAVISASAARGERVTPDFTVGFGGVMKWLVADFSTTVSFFACGSESSAMETFFVLLLADLLLRTDDRIDGFRGNLELWEGCP